MKSIRVVGACIVCYLWGVHVYAQSSPWEEYMRAALDAADQANYVEAAEKAEAGLKIAEKFGPDDPRLAITLSNLGGFYDAQRKYSEAERIHLRVLAIRERTLAPDDPRLATTLNNLAAHYGAQRKYAKEEPYLRRALAIREKGSSYQGLVITLKNAAEFYRGQGQYDQAEIYYKRAIDILQTALGPDHPKVAENLKRYTSMLRESGRAAEATKLEAEIGTNQFGQREIVKEAPDR